MDITIGLFRIRAKIFEMCVCSPALQASSNNKSTSIPEKDGRLRQGIPSDVSLPFMGDVSSFCQKVSRFVHYWMGIQTFGSEFIAG